MNIAVIFPGDKASVLESHIRGVVGDASVGVYSSVLEFWGDLEGSFYDRVLVSSACLGVGNVVEFWREWNRRGMGCDLVWLGKSGVDDESARVVVNTLTGDRVGVFLLGSVTVRFLEDLASKSLSVLLTGAGVCRRDIVVGECEGSSVMGSELGGDIVDEEEPVGDGAVIEEPVDAGAAADVGSTGKAPDVEEPVGVESVDDVPVGGESVVKEPEGKESAGGNAKGTVGKGGFLRGVMGLFRKGRGKDGVSGLGGGTEDRSVVSADEVSTGGIEGSSEDAMGITEGTVAEDTLDVKHEATRSVSGAAAESTGGSSGSDIEVEFGIDVDYLGGQDTKKVSEQADGDEVELVITDDLSKDVDLFEDEVRERTTVVKEVFVGGSGGDRARSLLSGEKRGNLFLVTGDRGTGVTRTALEFATYLCDRKRTVLYIDCDIKGHGLLSYVDYGDFLVQDEPKLDGIYRCSEGKDLLTYSVVHDNGLRVLTSDYSAEVNEGVFPSLVGAITDGLEDYDVVVVDVGLEYLSHFESLYPLARSLVCVEGSRRGYMNYLCRMDLLTVSDASKKLLLRRSKGMVVVGDTGKVLKGVRDEFQAGLDWLGLDFQKYGVISDKFLSWFLG